MRIIAGKYKGRKIDFPRQIRPTQDKVRGAIFNYLSGVVEGACVLDLFAGCGAFGIEALSRGAERACFIDIDKKCSYLIHRNLEGLGIRGINVEVFTQDTDKALKILGRRGKLFDLVFLDPPYYKGLAKKALKSLVHSGILHPRSFVIVECSKKDELDIPIEGLTLLKELVYGSIKISVFSVNS
ncbi:MAG: 16S rRNA (guanine(966)-N(2))-methyltransferase RsmD [Candidatus Omnitrophota bacterium]